MGGGPADSADLTDVAGAVRWPDVNTTVTSREINPRQHHRATWEWQPSEQWTWACGASRPRKQGSFFIFFYLNITGSSKHNIHTSTHLLTHLCTVTPARTSIALAVAFHRVLNSSSSPFIL